MTKQIHHTYNSEEEEIDATVQPIQHLHPKNRRSGKGNSGTIALEIR